MDKIAFFTPLPPIESGISDYSVDILIELSKYFDIDVFIDDYIAICKLPKNVKIVNYKIFNKNNYKNIIYQMGNNGKYHLYMLKYIQKYGGILVLHDYNLKDFVYYACFKELKNINLFKKYLLEDMNENKASKYLQDIQNNNYSNNLELNGFVTKYVNKIIVHSDFLQQKLHEKYQDKNIKKILHYSKINSQISVGELKKHFHINTNTIIFAAFGSIQNTKRVIPILKAFYKLSKEYSDIYFLWIGEISATLKDQFYQLINRLQLNKIVAISHYINLNTFDTFIDLSDICLNLRYPYNGENSGSLSRLLSKGKCTIINDIGSFSEIPDNACFKIQSAANISEETEINNIYNAMRTLLQDKIMRYNIEKKARLYAEQFLDIKIIVQQYKNFILK